MALSGDGNTALIGAPDDNGASGPRGCSRARAASWTQQGSKLTGSGESGAGNFGVSVALSGDGNTALIGGSVDDGGVGAAWVFARSGSELDPAGVEADRPADETGAGAFGCSVALSADGQHGADRRRRDDGSGSRGGVGVHSIGRDVVAAGVEARPPPTRPARAVRRQRGAVR